MKKSFFMIVCLGPQMSYPLLQTGGMKNNKSIQPALGRSQSSVQDQIVERVAAAAPAALPEEYWYPAVPRPRRASLWNTLNRTRYLQPA